MGAIVSIQNQTYFCMRLLRIQFSTSQEKLESFAWKNKWDIKVLIDAQPRIAQGAHFCRVDVSYDILSTEPHYIHLSFCDVIPYHSIGCRGM